MFLMAMPRAVSAVPRVASIVRARPFIGGLLSAAGGLTILVLPADQYTVFTLPGVAGLAGFLLGGLITALGILVWFQPRQHAIAGIVIVLAALASFVYSNLGGFLIGMLLALTGGSLVFAWAPGSRRTAIAQGGERTDAPATCDVPEAREVPAREERTGTSQTNTDRPEPGPGSEDQL